MTKIKSMDMAYFDVQNLLRKFHNTDYLIKLNNSVLTVKYTTRKNGCTTDGKELINGVASVKPSVTNGVHKGSVLGHYCS